MMAMKHMTLMGIVCGILACNRHNEPESHGGDEAHGASHERAAHADNGHDGKDHDGEKEEHEGHAHGETEGAADLDMPVAERFRARCEHDMATFECDECRYEVGVVKAPEHLFEGGLIHRARATLRPVSVPLRLTGEIQFDERKVAHVSTQAEGLIRKVHVTLGDTVAKGDPLVTLASVTVGEAQAALQEAEAELRLARRNAERMQALHDEKIAAEKETLQATQALEAAEIRVAAARGKLKRLGTRGGAANATGTLVLRSPVDGTVLDMHAVAGEVARPDGPLLTVGDNTSLWVWADLYERDLAAVLDAQARAPLDAEIHVKAFPERAFPGSVDFVSPSMDAVSRTVKLRVAVPNSDRKLLAGMFTEVDLFIPGDEVVIAVPKGAVLSDEGRSFVFVHHDGDYYTRLKVETGRRFGEWVEIISGLEPNTTVVTDGAFLMKSDVLRSKMGAGCAD